MPELSSPNLGLFNNHKLVRTMVQFCLKHGKKTLATRLINSAFVNFIDQVNSNLSVIDLLNQLESKIVSRVGFFKRRLGSKSYRIPYVMA